MKKLFTIELFSCDLNDFIIANKRYMAFNKEVEYFLKPFSKFMITRRINIKIGSLWR